LHTGQEQGFYEQIKLTKLTASIHQTQEVQLFGEEKTVKGTGMKRGEGAVEKRGRYNID